jgi:arginine/lysine/ornithine decarboxylase
MDKVADGIIQSIAYYIGQDPVRMHMPGHKGRLRRKQGEGRPQGGDEAASHMSGLVLDALDAVKPLDVTEVPGLDNLHYPSGPIKAVQDAMADTFGTAATYCLINGATAGILASLIAVRMTMGPGMVVVPRNAHRSIISGLILSGLEPLFVYPEYDSRFGGYLPLKVSDVQAQLEKAASEGRRDMAGEGRLCGVVVVNPTFTGVCRDITEICEYADGLGVPVIVDEAHGTLFALSERLPRSAIEAGAALVVHGVHKTTEALTQTGLLHVTPKCVASFPALAVNVAEALRLVQSTSPSYILLASLERAIRSLKHDETWVESMIQSAHLIKGALSGFRGISVRVPQGAGWDPVKILVDVSGLGLSGPRVQELLWDEARVVPEMAGPDHVLLMVTGADTSDSVEKLVKAFRRISDGCLGLERPGSAGLCSELLTREPPRAERAMPLSRAFYSGSKDYSLEESVGRVSCDTVMIYPPGSPVVVPGEKITAEIAGYLRAAVECGLQVLGRGYACGGEELRVFCLEQ